MRDDVEALLRDIAEAEIRGDASLYEQLCNAAFRAVGPVGFVLDRQQWIGRFHSGKYVCTRYQLSEVSLVESGDVVLALARADIEASFEGKANPVAATRVLHIFQRTPPHWQLLGVQHSGPLQPSKGGA